MTIGVMHGIKLIVNFTEHVLRMSVKFDRYSMADVSWQHILAHRRARYQEKGQRSRRIAPIISSATKDIPWRHC